MIADFVPDETKGKIIVYSRPDPNRVNGYIATLDPAEDDNVEKTRDTSNLSLSIISKPYGTEPAKLVLEYCHRPLKLVEYYQEMAYVLLWYRTKVHVELNRGGWRVLQYFQEVYPELLALLPSSYNSAKGGLKMTHGYRITPERKSQMKSLGDAYVENYWMYIPSVRLIDELKVVGASGKDDDLAMAFLAGLMILQGDPTPVQNINQTITTKPTAGFKKVNGRIERVVANNSKVPSEMTVVNPLTGKTPLQHQTRRKSALFKF